MGKFAEKLRPCLLGAVAILVAAGPGGAAAAPASHFRGWQVLRVMEQTGRPDNLIAADIDADGRPELIVVNRRSSRLDIYHWLPVDKRDAPDTLENEQPNELPMAVDFQRDQLQLEIPPLDAVALDLDGDRREEVIVLSTPRNRLQVFSYQDDGKWNRRFRIQLLEGDPAHRRRALMLRKLADGVHEALVSFEEGIQSAALEEGARAGWLTPRDKRSRDAWWLADLDVDGRADLVEQASDGAAALRWRRAGDANFASAQALFDRAIADAVVLGHSESPRVAVLESSAANLIRIYRLQRGVAGPLGRQQPLSAPGREASAWCGIEEGEHKTLILADPQRPRLLAYRLTERGWGPERTYPAIANVRGLAAPAAQPGTLLVWAKDADELYRCQWEAGRFTYPAPWPLAAAETKKKILALGSVGKLCWWVQVVGKHLDLYRWGPGEAEPSRTRFEDVGPKSNEVLWIGGDRLLVKQQHARAIQLVQRHDEQTTVSSPSHLRNASLTEFKLLQAGDANRLGRFTDGVLQWIGDDMHSTDQIMLPHGQKLVAYVPLDASTGWALENDAKSVHRIAADASGVLQAVERVEVEGGENLMLDPLLGLILIGPHQITRLGEGRAEELQLVSAVNRDVARSLGVKTTRFHRLGAADLDGDGVDEVLLFDDLQHRITALTLHDDQYEPLISWPLFDDRIYPYNDEPENLVRQPRAIVGADFDGDGLQDLAMICHDRLIVYLAAAKDEAS